MPILIDGNNLMYSLPSGERERAEVRRLTLDLTRRERISVILVFDGPPPETRAEREFLGSVEIRYSGSLSADDAIVGIIRKSRAPRNWKVVTDDRELRQRVRVLGAACLSCSEWKNRRRRRSVRQRNTDRSEGPRMSARELREWEEYFNGS